MPDARDAGRRAPRRESTTPWCHAASVREYASGVPRDPPRDRRPHGRPGHGGQQTRDHPASFRRSTGSTARRRHRSQTRDGEHHGQRRQHRSGQPEQHGRRRRRVPSARVAARAGSATAEPGPAPRSRRAGDSAPREVRPTRRRPTAPLLAGSASPAAGTIAIAATRPHTTSTRVAEAAKPVSVSCITDACHEREPGVERPLVHRDRAGDVVRQVVGIPRGRDRLEPLGVPMGHHPEVRRSAQARHRRLVPLRDQDRARR